jgi:beta-glucosidase
MPSHPSPWTQPGPAGEPVQRHNEATPLLRFPDGFLWGTATASYQIEGAVAEDGRGPSIWDAFCHTPGKVFHGDTGDIACDHYHRWEQDVSLMARLGLNSYRLSVAWPRVQPDGSGALNQPGLDFYRRLVDRLVGHGIAPVVTLYHWDLPQTLEDAGGWANRDTAGRFAEYAYEVVRALGDGVVLWITLNEPWVSAHLGYGDGTHAPGRADLSSAFRAAHHLLLGHGLAAAAVRSVMAPASKLGITLNLSPSHPASASAADVQAATRVDGYVNRWFLGPIFRGEYPEDVAGLVRPVAGEAYVRPGDMEDIKAPIDFLGVNYYYCHAVAAIEDTPRPGDRPFPAFLRAVERPDATVPITGRGWPVQPGGLHELLTRLDADLRHVPLYVTENGAAFPDYVGPDGAVNDPERVDFLDRHLKAAHDALVAGVDLRGYFCWTLIDNFEWAAGYSQRFGLVWVDFKTQERIPKSSASWYAGVASRNGLIPGE